MEVQKGRIKGKRKSGTAAAFLITLAAVPAVSWAQAGTLDTSFGNGGTLFTDFGGEDRALGMVVQPDGKIVAAGWSRQDGVDGFGMARYMPDGALDPSFGSGGKLSFTHPQLDQHYAIALQADGRIIVGGTTTALGSADFILARFLPNGRLDTRFGKKGIVTSDFGITDVLAAIAIQPDGKIVAAGYASGDSNLDFAVARYLPNGSPDTTFGTQGKVRTDFLGGFDLAASIALQPGGRIVVVGWADGTDGHPKFAAVRYRSNGALDTTFGGTGKVTTTIGEDARATSVVSLSSSGKLVLAGHAVADEPFESIALARYHFDGTLDESFGNAGIVVTSIGESVVMKDVTVQPDGKLIAGGGGFGFIVARYHGNGLLDNSFSDDGIATIRFNGGGPAITGIALQPATGRLVVAGYSFVNVADDFTLARFHLAP